MERRPWLIWVRDLGPLFVAVAFNTMVTLSSDVMRWWSHESDPDTTPLPDAADRVLRACAATSDADVHVVLWFVGALTLAWAVRKSPARTVVFAGSALWIYTALLEFCQRWVPGRTSQWTDLAANAIGITLGLLVGLGAIRLLRRPAPAELEAQVGGSL